MNPRINKADENGFTPLYVAAKNNHTPIIERLLKTGNIASLQTLEKAYTESYDVIAKRLLNTSTSFQNQALLSAYNQRKFILINKLLAHLGIDHNHLKKTYQEHRGSWMRSASIFNSNDLSIILQRLSKRAENNPHGASANTLLDLGLLIQPRDSRSLAEYYGSDYQRERMAVDVC